jgi:uncharacterized protein (TIGR02246 family)
MTSTHASTDVTDLNRQWGEAFNAGDLSRLMEFYEPDAVLVPGPDAQPVRGLKAIEASLRQFLALGGQIHFTPRHWLVHDDLALGSITFTLDGGHDADGNPVDLHGTTSELVRRQPDGTWKYLIDHPFGGA